MATKRAVPRSKESRSLSAAEARLVKAARRVHRVYAVVGDALAPLSKPAAMSLAQLVLNGRMVADPEDSWIRELLLGGFARRLSREQERSQLRGSFLSHPGLGVLVPTQLGRYRVLGAKR